MGITVISEHGELFGGEARIPVLWICGPPGVGKSTIAWEVYSRLAQDGVSCAYVDIDQLGICYPGRSDEGHEVKAPNLGAVVENFRNAGARIVIVSGVIDAPAVAIYVEAAPAATLKLIRLRLSPEALRARILARSEDAVQLADQVIEYAEALDRGDFPAPCLETDGAAITDAVDQVIRRAETLLRDAPAPADLAPCPARTKAASASRAPMLWLCGPAAVGKSTIGWRIFDEVRNSGTKAAFVDLQQIGFLYPAPPDDPGNHRLKAFNLASMWSTFRADGAGCMVVVGTIDSADETQRYREALPTVDLTVCRLSAGRSTLVDRIAARAAGSGPRLAGDGLLGRTPNVLAMAADRAIADNESMSRAGMGDLCVDTDGRTVEDLARAIRGLTGDWPGEGVSASR